MDDRIDRDPVRHPRHPVGRCLEDRCRVARGVDPRGLPVVRVPARRAGQLDHDVRRGTAGRFGRRGTNPRDGGHHGGGHDHGERRAPRADGGRGPVVRGGHLHLPRRAPSGHRRPDAVAAVARAACRGRAVRCGQDQPVLAHPRFLSSGVGHHPHERHRLRVSLARFHPGTDRLCRAGHSAARGEHPLQPRVPLSRCERGRIVGCARRGAAA